MSYDFRYSKLAPNSILGFLFILIFVLVGLVISIIILFYIINYKILEAKEATFWEEHQKLVFSSILWFPVMSVSLFSILGSISYRHLIDDKSGVLDISNNYITDISKLLKLKKLKTLTCDINQTANLDLLPDSVKITE